VKHSHATVEKTSPKSLLAFLEEERIRHGSKAPNFIVSKIDDSQLWLESIDGFIFMKLLIHYETQEMLYDVCARSTSPKCDMHLTEEIINDLGKLDLVVGAIGKWQHEESIDDLWFIFHWIRIWTKRKRLRMKRAKLV
jgi:hypothetical protein